MKLNSRQSVQAALDLLAVRLNGIIANRLADTLGPLPWTTILNEVDRARGMPPRNYSANDLQPQLRMLTERLGGLGYPFEVGHPREVSTLGNELRIARNRWSHHDSFTVIDAWRIHDFVLRLLELFADHEGVALGSDDRAAALAAVVAEQGAEPAKESLTAQDEPTLTASQEDLVEPDPAALVRDNASAQTPNIGSQRTVFEPWRVVRVGDVSVLDDLPKKAAKEQVRAVVTEIAEFEGPIHLDRLTSLCAASFGVGKLHAKRKQQLVRQVKAAGLSVDSDNFVWPTGLTPTTWHEFRPNRSDADRPFLQISPAEIANAARWWATHVYLPGDLDVRAGGLERFVLMMFGRKRLTKSYSKHIKQALAQLDDLKLCA